MPRYTVTDFDGPAFWGKEGQSLPGGYGDYQPDSARWAERAQLLFDIGGLAGLKVLDLGCAWGSLVLRLRRLGVDAYGVDLSYPISQGVALWPELGPYLTVADARVWVPTQARNSWDVIVSRGFLACMSDVDLAALIPAMNYAGKKQIHIVDPTDDPQFYNVKTLAQWRALPFGLGTLILDE